jgi:hypothetical protein
MGLNFTAKSISSSVDYLTNNYFKKTLVGFVFAEGTTFLQVDPVDGCKLRVDDNFVTNPTLTLAAGQTYEFYTFNPDRDSDGLRVFKQPAQVDEIQSGTNNFEVSGGQGFAYKAVVWTVGADLVGSSLEYYCSDDFLLPAGTINIVVCCGGWKVGFCLINVYIFIHPMGRLPPRANPTQSSRA